MKTPLTLCIALFVLACSSPPERHPVPKNLVDEAAVPGFTDIRAFSGEPSAAFTASFADSILAERPEDFPRDANGVRRYPVLMISAGGSNGAFGAGLLCGMTEKGTRPVYKLVTGVSTGALLAPFAFVGPKYDKLLKQMYTTLHTKDIIEMRSIFNILWGESGVDSAPLRKLLDTYIDDEFIADVAKAHAHGRRLYVSTANLDAERMVVWDLGAIAATDHPDAPRLFRDVLLAAASVPVAFPPGIIGVEAGGKSYDEMHVDGGMKAMVFLDGETIDPEVVIEKTGLKHGQVKLDIYILRNGPLYPQYQAVERKLASIAGRTVSSMLKSMALRDMYRYYADAGASENATFRYAAIPKGFEFQAEEEFDPGEMGKLFEIGYRQAVEDEAWMESQPPYYLRPPGALWK